MVMRRLSATVQALRQIQLPEKQKHVRRAYSRFQWRGSKLYVPQNRPFGATYVWGRSFAASALELGPSATVCAWVSVSPRLAQMLSAHKKRLASRLHDFELTLAALVCSVTDTRSGQRLLAGILPLAAMVTLFPSRFHARAWETPHHMPARLTADKKQWLTKLTLPEPVAAALEEFLIWMRGLYLALLFTPVLLLAPLVFGYGLGDKQGRDMWLDLLLLTIQHAGPAFIKWAQWSSSRPDLFPEDLCRRFETLQSSAPSHDGQLSKDVIDSVFKHLSSQPLFESIDLEPVASGSIAQVHRARLSQAGAALTGRQQGQVVAIKVRHPGVTHIMHRDFVLMQRAAQMAGLLPALASLRLDESIRQFGGPLKEQLNLEAEARHLQRFNHNFRRWTNVSFPRPLYPLVAPNVLVETFEEGDLISAYVKLPEPSKQRSLLAETGLNLYLQMLLKDNFCHADLHPGNILVREVDRRTLRGLPRLLSSLLHVEFEPRLVLLDAGMIAELKPTDQRNLVDFFRALTKQDGQKLARSILTLSEIHTCKDPDAFVVALTDMFDRLDPETISKNTNAVFKDMIETLRQHQVTLKSTVSTIVVTTLVLEGWSSKLDPELHILDTMRDLLGTDWSERISRTVDRIMISGSVAMA